MFINISFVFLFVILISLQDLFAGAPEFSGERVTPEAAWIQRPLLGQMIPDTMWHILKNLSLTEGWMFLSVNKNHHTDVDVWRGFSGLHGNSVIKGATTAEKIRGEFMGGLRNALQKEIQSTDPFTSVLIAHFLQKARERSFLWSTLITTLREKAFPESSIAVGQDTFNLDVAFGNGFFRDVSEADRRMYLVAVTVQRNSDDIPIFGAESAQQLMNNAAYQGKFGFTEDRGAPTSAYDYLVAVAARKNPDGTSGVGADHAQLFLNLSAYHGKLGFTKDRGGATSGYNYLEAVASQRNLEGKPSISAKHAQKSLNNAAVLGKLGFTSDRGTPTSGDDYLESIAARKNPDGSPGIGAKYARVVLGRFPG